MLCPSCQSAIDARATGCPTCGTSLPAESDATLPFVRNAGATPAPAAAEDADDATRIVETPAERDADSTRVMTHKAPSGGGFSTFMSPVTAAATSTALAPESVLAGRYNIISSLGEGGMGAVYKAHDLEVDRLVAIKVIRPELASNPQILQRFKQELVLARQVTHRNVARVYDLGAAGDLKFISMEFIEGKELASILEDAGKLPPKQAAEIMLQVCQGLAAAHAEGVVHRDLKPQNIMIDDHGRAAVMDFGIAHSVQSAAEPAPQGAPAAPVAAGLTQVGALLGTPRYMSPEQARAEKVDERSDIFTVGLILYELLTGITPFRGKTGKETLRKRIEETAKPPIDLDPRIPKALNRIVMKCLERDPANRYANATEVVNDLEIMLGIRSPVRAAQIRRMRWMAAALGTLLLSSAGFIVWNYLEAEAKKPRPTVKLLISDFANRTDDPRLDGTLEPMFQVALERAAFINTYNRGSARRIGTELNPGATRLDEPVARLVALREGLGVIVSGSIEKRGSGFQLSVKAVDAGKGETLVDRGQSVSDTAQLPEAVESLAGRIRRALGDRGGESAETAAETFTSASLAAAQRYSQAQDLQWAGKWDEAIAAYRQAVEIDPNLSRAYSGLAATLANLGRRAEAEQYYQLALTHINRMSEREKFRTRGGYYLMTRDYPKAAEQFKALVNQFPADTAGIANLALSRFYERDMEAALAEGQRAVDIYPNNLLQRNNVGLYAMYAGDFDRAIRESNEILKINPSFEKAYLCLAIAHLGKGDEAASEAAYAKMAGLSEWGASQALLGRADIAMYRGRFSEAAALLQKGIAADLEKKNTSGAAKKLVMLASVQALRGQRAAALESASKAVGYSEDESILYPAARVYIDSAAPERALSIAAKLDARFGPEPRATAKLIEAEAQLKAGKVRDAVESFQAAQKIADTWLGRYGLGRAYLAAELYPDADGEFDVCLKRRGEATAVFLDDDPSVHYLPPVFYYQGRAREGLKSPGAAESFQAFLEMRETAENDPLVTDAKRRITARSR
jgi:eukaryotic-like serine/threonine-protein kinase